MTPQEVTALIKDKGSRGGRPALRRPARPMAALHDVDEGVRRRRVRGRRRVRRVEQSAGSRRSRKATCCWCRTRLRHSSIRSRPRRTLVLICNVKDPVTGESYSRDPRYIAQKAEAYLKSTGIGDTAYFGPEPEFFILDDVRFGQSYNEGFYHLDAAEGFWNAGRVENPDEAGHSRNLGYKPRYKEGYFPVPPMDSHQDLRTEMMLTLESIGVEIEVHHHEVATGGQAEIDMRFDSLVSMGDKLLKYKYVIKNVARRHGKVVTLMPKPVFQDQRLGHARAPEHLAGRSQHVLRGRHLRRPEQDRALLHRRDPEARPGAAGVLQPDDELVPPAGARLRGADQPDLLPSATGARPSGFRPTRAARRPSASNAGSRTRPATAISRSARC